MLLDTSSCLPTSRLVAKILQSDHPGPSIHPPTNENQQKTTKNNGFQHMWQDPTFPTKSTMSHQSGPQATPRPQKSSQADYKMRQGDHPDPPNLIFRPQGHQSGPQGDQDGSQGHQYVPQGHPNHPQGSHNRRFSKQKAAPRTNRESMNPCIKETTNQRPNETMNH